ncbi:YbjQ family protein [Oerskovia enterophila]|uniref:YbjQ family protein n=1 Tax=Oerskovia TaxID=162491 RepID=UPI0033918D45
MLVSTMNDVPGRTVQQVIGEVTGLTVRSRNVGAQIGAGLKSIVGGELKGLTKQLQQSRDEAVARMVEGATAQGANAILAMRYDSDEVGNGYQEIVAYGTAVVLAP